MITIIIPTLNSAADLKRALPPLIAGVEAALVRDLVIADAGSNDATLAIADAAGALSVRSALGEGAQSIAGATAARGEWFLFLHAGAALEASWVEEAAGAVSGNQTQAYVFRIGGRGWFVDLVENMRAVWLKTAPRTHGLLIARELYQSLGGYTAAPGAHKEFLARIGAARLRVLQTRAVLEKR